MPAGRFPPGSYPPDSRVLGGTQATQQQYRAVPAAPIRRQGGQPAPPGAPDYVPPVDDYARAKALFAQLLGPQIDSLNSLYAGRAKSGMDAIGGFTKQLAAALAPLAGQMQGIYGGAEQSQASSDAALRQALVGGGQGLADALAGKLGAINAPGAQIADVAGGQAQTGVGAGNAGFALGSAELGRLIGTGTAEQTFAAKQPGIAGFTGLQKAGELQQSLQSELAGKVADLQSKQGDFVQGDVQGRQSARAAAASQQERLREFNLKSKQTLAIAQDRSQQGWARIQQGTANAADRRVYQANLLQLRQQGIITKQEYDAQTLALRKRGQDITLRGQDLTNARAGGKGGNGANGAGLRAAAKQADLYYNGSEGTVRDSLGKTQLVTADMLGGKTFAQYAKANGFAIVKQPTAAVTYQDALRKLGATGLSLEQSQSVLNAFYKPGEGGGEGYARPFLSVQERQALAAGGVNPDAIKMATWNGQKAAQLRQNYAGILKRAQSAGAPPLGGANNTAYTTGANTLAGVNDTAWAKSLLSGIGAPATAANLQFISAWIRAEGTKARYNPLAVTDRMPGSTAFNSNGGYPVQNFAKPEHGLQATVQHLTKYTPGIIRALKSGRLTARQLAQEVLASGWGTSDIMNFV